MSSCIDYYTPADEPGKRHTFGCPIQVKDKKRLFQANNVVYMCNPSTSTGIYRCVV